MGGDFGGDDACLNRWLEELSDALDQAQRLMSLMGLARGHSVRARELSARIEMVRVEIDYLRRNGWDGPVHLPPNWIETLLDGAKALDAGR